MRKQTLILAIIPILAVSFAVAFYAIGWTEPTSPPPSGNISLPLNTGNIGQSKAGGLILNTGGAANGLIVDKGNLCLGTDCRSTWPTATSFGQKTNLDSSGAVLVVNSIYRATSDGFINANGYSQECYLQARNIGGTFAIVSRGGNWHDASWYDALFYAISKNEEIQWICLQPQNMWFKPFGSGQLDKQ